MRPYRLTLTVVAVLALALALPVWAQQPEPQPAPQPQAQGAPARAPRAPLVPLEVQVMISRYKGEKRISSVPYVLAVNTNGFPSQLNVGADVPIPSPAFAPVASGDSKTPAPAPIRSYNYRNIGTNIACQAVTADEGRFELTVNVDESSVYTKDDAPGAAGLGEVPVFRSFKSRNMLLLRDGQSRQYTAATDRVSGETIRIDVTLKVVK